MPVPGTTSVLRPPWLAANHACSGFDGTCCGLGHGEPLATCRESEPDLGRVVPRGLGEELGLYGFQGSGSQGTGH